MDCLPRSLGLNCLNAAKASTECVLFSLFSAHGLCFALEQYMSASKLNGNGNIVCRIVETFILKYTENRLCGILLLCGYE